MKRAAQRGVKSPSALALNAGSATLRFAAFDLASRTRWLEGEADKLGSPSAVFACGVEGAEPVEEPIDASITFEDALSLIKDAALANLGPKRELAALVHRVVHGGSALRSPVVVNSDILQQIDACSPMAPQHNPLALQQIRACQDLFPDQRHIACFDTAFHTTIPRRAYLYALPLRYLEEHGIRRYGFHGFSHLHAAREVAKALDMPMQRLSLISVHLGNGCSINATSNGESVDNSMGFTPLEGMAMGSRSGDVDPGLFGYLNRQLGMGINEIEELLYKQSGLKGLSGISNDMRELRAPEAESNPRVEIALEVFAYRLAKGIAAARVALDELDAIAFTGGIGFGDSDTRARVVHLLAFLGCALDEGANREHGARTRGRINVNGSRPAIFAIPVNEEAEMVASCAELI